MKLPKEDTEWIEDKEEGRRGKGREEKRNRPLIGQRRNADAEKEREDMKVIDIHMFREKGER